MRYVCLLITVMLLTSCATRERYEASVKTYVGQPISAVMNDWGYPSGSFQSPTGNTVYVWETLKSGVSPRMSVGVYGGHWPGGFGTSVGYGLGGSSDVRRCQTYFEVDAKKIITHWRLQGDCRQ